MSLWDDFLSRENFQLAWARIIRSMHGDTKDRLALRAFNHSLDRNLKLLRSQIERDTYEPSTALKLYQPKRAGTLRTLSILTVADRIVYQAMGNVIANQSNSDLQVFANRQVYAHVYAGASSKFMLRYWRRQYPQFMRSLAAVWSRGNRWCVRADIASYYDSIDHESLIDLLRERWVDEHNLLGLLGRCLDKWSPHEGGPHLARGLPQGYETSDFLSSLFLYPVDQGMCRKGYDDRYRRYVDDARFLVDTREGAQRALIDYDLALKSVGLIVQGSKTSITRADSVDDLRDPDWAILSLVQQTMSVRPQQAQDELRHLFFEGLEALPKSDYAEGHVVFALGRLDPYQDVRDQVLRLLQIMPWRSSVLTKYLRHFEGDPYTIERLRRFVDNHHVYGWHLANCLDCLLDMDPTGSTYELCRRWIVNAELPWYQRLAAAQGLGRMPDGMPFCNARAEVERTSEMVRKGLLASCYRLAEDSEQQARVIRMMLSDEDEEIRRTGLFFLLANDDLSWEDFEDLEEDLGPLGNLVPDLVPSDEEVKGQGYIAETFVAFFGVTTASGMDFGPVFGSLYDTASRHLRIAVGAHDTSASRYVTRLDNFNNIAVWRIYDNLLPNETYRPEDTLNNIARSSFRQVCPVLAGAFSHCHEVRSRCAEAHPYSRSLGAVSEEVTRPERDRVTSSLRAAYTEFVGLFTDSLS